jgi:hypothetical protein
MTNFNNTNKISEILQQHQIKFIKTNNKLELQPDQDLTAIPSKKIVKMLGLKQDKGHIIFIEKLNQIENNWLQIFIRYESYYGVYNAETEIINENFYALINEILDGLQ